MVFVEHSVTFKGDLQSAWDKLVDWKRMRDWDIFIDEVKFDGPLKVGSVGQLKARDGHIYVLTVTDLNSPNNYSDEISIMGSRFVFFHELSEKTPGEITMRFTISATGLIAFIFQYPINNAFALKLPILMDNFKQQYEESFQKSKT
ncbi:MAG: SRPBCC family protein [Candidatus Melainabacteria bacterium]|nr:SRPBCC family protein [Candidatus Melainabacteria bacterium]